MRDVRGEARELRGAGRAEGGGDPGSEGRVRRAERAEVERGEGRSALLDQSARR